MCIKSIYDFLLVLVFIIIIISIVVVHSHYMCVPEYYIYIYYPFAFEYRRAYNKTAWMEKEYGGRVEKDNDED